jgi:hypothetical protein
MRIAMRIVKLADLLLDRLAEKLYSIFEKYFDILFEIFVSEDFFDELDIDELDYYKLD